MRLEQKDRVRLVDAIAASFEAHELDRILIGALGFDLSHISSVVHPKPLRALELERFFYQRNEEEKLLTLLRGARPSVPEFTFIAQNAGLVILPSESELEVLISTHVPGIDGTPFQSPSEFRAKMAIRENSVCRIEIPGVGTGTGTLVGEAAVLTNFHVVEGVLGEDGNLTGKVLCRFNHRDSDHEDENPSIVVDAIRVLCFSPYSEANPSGQTDATTEDSLDYALLELDRKISTSPIVEGGELRGSTPIIKTVDTVENQGVLAIQHPSGQPLRMDLGTVTLHSYNRIQHSINTLPGSSGSPIFDAALRFVALHHVGVDWPYGGKPYNQAIPIRLIAEDIAAKGVSLTP